MAGGRKSGRSRAAGQTTNNGPSMRSQMRRLRHDIQGHEIVPPADPTSFVELPWNSWTFERTATSAVADQGDSITVADILAQLKARVGLSSTAVTRIKVQSARMWCTSAGQGFPHPDMRSSYYEINGQTQSATVRKLLRDIGTLNVPAKTGYQYPIDDRKEILTSADSAVLVCGGVVVEINSRLTIRIQLLWQSTGP